MRTTIGFAIAAALSLVAPVARAQRATPELVRSNVSLAADSIAALAPRTLALFTFASPSDAGMPTEVAVGDSAGVIVAEVRHPQAGAARAMSVRKNGTDLILQGDTPAGALNLVLYQTEGAPVGTVIGRWTLGGMEGKLRAAR